MDSEEKKEEPQADQLPADDSPAVVDAPDMSKFFRTSTIEQPAELKAFFE